MAKLRWDRIMEDINGGANDAWLKKKVRPGRGHGHSISQIRKIHAVQR